MACLESKPHIVPVVESLQIGGAQKLVADFSAGPGNDSTSVICLRQVGALGESLSAQSFGVDLVGWDRPRWQCVLRVSRFLKLRSAALVHCHNPLAHLYGSLGAMLAGGLPVVMTKHGMREIPGGISGAINRLLMRRAQVVAVSEDARAMMQSV